MTEFQISNREFLDIQIQHFLTFSNLFDSRHCRQTARQPMLPNQRLVFSPNVPQRLIDKYPHNHFPAPLPIYLGSEQYVFFLRHISILDVISLVTPFFVFLYSNSHRYLCLKYSSQHSSFLRDTCPYHDNRFLTSFQLSVRLTSSYVLVAVPTNATKKRNNASYRRHMNSTSHKQS